MKKFIAAKIYSLIRPYIVAEIKREANHIAGRSNEVRRAEDPVGTLFEKISNGEYENCTPVFAQELVEKLKQKSGY